MCTVSIVTQEKGFLLGMNRDEKIARGSGVVPQIRDACGVAAIYPEDGAGGTWIGANEFGVALALLNWNDVGSAIAENGDRRSRGQVIPAVIGCSSVDDVHRLMSGIDLRGMPPFRLIGVFLSAKQTREWQWDSVRLKSLRFAWVPRHSFSSSISDKQASATRGQICTDALDDSDAGSKVWLRRLHTSHKNGPGAFSICVHRPDVATLSYSEIEVTHSGVCFSHCVGSPCLGGRCNETVIGRSAVYAAPEGSAID